MGDSQRERWATVQRKLDGMYPDQQYEINQTLSELLVRLETPRVIEKTIRLLQATTFQAEQMHYLFVLRNVDRGWTLSEREIYFSSLQQADRFVAGAGMSEFIRRIREEAIETLSDHERTRLAPLLAPQPDIHVTATTVDRPFVEQWTVQKLLSSDRAARGDAREGAEIFAAACCNQCHRMAGRGRSLGPDLTAASRRFSREDLLKAIVDPSQVIAENYRSVQILTEDGKAHVGQIVTSGDYRSPQLRLATDPNRPTEVIEIDKSAIVDRKLSPISWMPEGLLDTFTRDEIFHLLAYLESSGGLAP